MDWTNVWVGKHIAANTQPIQNKRVWGRNDFIFPKEGAIPYQRDLKNIEVHLLNTGHFALEEDGELISELISRFPINI